MARKTANQAIDFARLFAVKEQLARQSAIESAQVEEEAIPERDVNETAPPSGETTVEIRATDVVSEVATAMADVIEFPAPAVQETERVVPLPPSAAVSPPLAPPAPQEPQVAAAALSSEADVMLRIGMSRALHERLRAYAALEGRAPTDLANSLLESRTPQFRREEPMSTLAKAAREAFPASAKRHRTEVRMQVGVDAGLHRRLHQLAALRAQTLIASVTDLFEAVVPEM